MRHALLLLSLGLLVGCDTFSNPAADMMSNLDGEWTRTTLTERIGLDGSVQTEGEPVVDAFDVALEVGCNATTLQNVSDEDRAAVAFNPADPRIRQCHFIKSDSRAQRIVFVVDALTDLAGTVRENTPSRHVWAFYLPQSDGTALRRTVTLTPR